MNTLSARDGSTRPVVLWAALAGIVCVWLAPITLAGRMPIGGDVTSFFLPLMAYYRQALCDGRVPFWTELWGYGFPMLAESQVGVFYPPHLLLFGLFQTETAYCLNIVLHQLLAAWFTYVCGRAFGLRPVGAMLAALVFAGNGFFIIHFTHQWAYTAGCWTPLAVALAWKSVRPPEEGGSVPRRFGSALGLAVVLAVQMLAGHYQIAFYTQVVLCLMALACTVQHLWHKRRAGKNPAKVRPGKSPRAMRPAERRPWGSGFAVLWIACPLALAFCLAALQILPTLELIRVALPQGRTFEYLSGFANTPFHLVSYLLPGLFHVNPMWRPVAWDPFHTSPEECFSYVGLFPICLAAGAAWRWRREGRVQLWVLLAAVTLIFSLGPYVPTFRPFTWLPGFSGFRSASRWGVATALFCALLAGRGLDGVTSRARLRLWVRRFAIVFFVVAGSAAALLFVVLRPAAPGAAPWIHFAEHIRWLVSPWPEDPPVDQIVPRASIGSREPTVYDGLARMGIRITVDPNAGDGAQWLSIGSKPERVRVISLSDLIGTTLGLELVPSCLFLGAGVTIVWFSHRGRRVRPLVLVALTAADLGLASWLRPVDFAPRGSLIGQSPVLAHLEQEFAGQRGLDSLQNLAMLAHAAPIRSYRTVDIPILESVNLVIFDPRFVAVSQRDRMIQRSDLRWFLFPGSSAGWSIAMPPQPTDADRDFSDPLLGRIVHGPGLSRVFPSSTSQFLLRQLNVPAPGRAWFVRGGDDGLGPQLVSTSTPLGLGARPLFEARLFAAEAEPLENSSALPERSEYELHAEAPGVVFVTELAYPGWMATLTSANGNETVPVLSTAGCQAVRISRAGDYHLTLQYRSGPFVKGLLISEVSCGAVALMLLVTWWFASRRP
jgi:hypothetical protein